MPHFRDCNLVPIKFIFEKIVDCKMYTRNDVNSASFRTTFLGEPRNAICEDQRTMLAHSRAHIGDIQIFKILVERLWFLYWRITFLSVRWMWLWNKSTNVLSLKTWCVCRNNEIVQSYIYSRFKAVPPDKVNIGFLIEAIAEKDSLQYPGSLRNNNLSQHRHATDRIHHKDCKKLPKVVTWEVRHEVFVEARMRGLFLGGCALHVS